MAHIRNYCLTRICSMLVLVAFVLTAVLPSAGLAQVIDMPLPGTPVALSEHDDGAALMGMQIDPLHPFQIDFLVNQGEDRLEGAALKDEALKFVKYFMASLTIPEKRQWVNLSPYESHRIIEDDFGRTVMGRDLLAQDYLLKQLTASLMYPEKEIGREFWKKIYDRIAARYGTTDSIPVDTFNKVWIIPKSAVVYEEGHRVWLVSSSLDVMLDKDYLALEKNKASGEGLQGEGHGTPDSGIATEMVREIILPAIRKEVNEGRNFALLRQVYQAMILATWYKQNLKQSVLTRSYADQRTVSGIDDNDAATNQRIYEQYLQAFRKGVFNYVKEEIDPNTNEVLPRKYFSGGFDAAQLGAVIEDLKGRDLGDLKALLAANTEARQRLVDFFDLLGGKRGGMCVASAYLMAGKVSDDVVMSYKSLLAAGVPAEMALSRTYLMLSGKDNGLMENALRASLAAVTALNPNVRVALREAVVRLLPGHTLEQVNVTTREAVLAFMTDFVLTPDSFNFAAAGGRFYSKAEVQNDMSKALDAMIFYAAAMIRGVNGEKDVVSVMTLREQVSTRQREINGKRALYEIHATAGVLQEIDLLCLQQRIDQELEDLFRARMRVVDSSVDVQMNSLQSRLMRWREELRVWQRERALAVNMGAGERVTRAQQLIGSASVDVDRVLGQLNGVAGSYADTFSPEMTAEPVVDQVVLTELTGAGWKERMADRMGEIERRLWSVVPDPLQPVVAACYTLLAAVGIVASYGAGAGMLKGHRNLDNAMAAMNGGIDLDAAFLALQTRGAMNRDVFPSKYQAPEAALIDRLEPMIVAIRPFSITVLSNMH